MPFGLFVLDKPFLSVGHCGCFIFSEERSRLFVYYPFNLKRLESVERLRSSPLIVSLFTDGHGAGLLFS